MRARVDALVGEPDKARLSAKYWLAVIRTEAALEKIESGSEEWRQTMALHLNALDKLARYRGWIVEKKQIARATVSLDKLTRGEIHAHLGRLLDELEPGARAEVQRMIDADRFTPR